jgi:TRAP-type C4-dicarboxylate transport system substrate-binding protein
MLQSSFVMGQPLLDSMSQEDRDFFLNTISEASVRWSNIIYEEEQGLFDGFRANGMTVISINIDEFQSAIAPLYTYNELGFSPGLRDTLFSQLGL